MTAPDWLTTRGGEMSPGLNERTWLITLSGHPMYRLVAGPAKGKFTCTVTQTNNGKRLDAGAEYPNLPGALSGGLEELRTKLGW